MSKYTKKDFVEFKQAKAIIAGANKNRVLLVLPDGTDAVLCSVARGRHMSEELQRKLAQRIADLWNVDRWRSKKTASQSPKLFKK